MGASGNATCPQTRNSETNTTQPSNSVVSDLKVKKKPKEQHMYICTYILSLHIKGIALYVTVTSSAIRAPNKYKGRQYDECHFMALT